MAYYEFIEKIRKERGEVRVAIYARYSSDMQTHQSIETQVETCMKFITELGCRVYKIYTDEAMSGRFKRPQLDLMCKDGMQHKYDIFMVYDDSRLYRNHRKFIDFIDDLLEEGIYYLNATDRLDPTEDTSNTIRALNGTINEGFSKRLSKRVFDGQMTTAHKLKSTGGRPPLGYDFDSERRLVINHYEAEIVRTIFEMVYKDMSYANVIEWLNENGYKTKTGQSFGKNSIYDLLQNEKYCGTFVYNKSSAKSRRGTRNGHKYKDESEIFKLEDAIPAIVTKEVFQTIQKRMGLRRKDYGNRAKVNYLLKGRIYCECGSRYAGNLRKNGSGNPYPTYRCERKGNKGSVACHNSDINKERLEEMVLKKLWDYVNNKANISILVEEYNSYYKKTYKDTDAKTKELKKRQKEIGQKIKKLTEVICRMDVDLFNDEIVNLDRENKYIKEKLIEAAEIEQNMALDPNDIKMAFKRAKELLEKNDSTLMNLIVETFIDSVTVYHDHIRILFNFYPNKPKPLNEDDDLSNNEDNAEDELNEKSHTHVDSVCMGLAEKEGFEPSRRLPRPTPLAGAPLRPNLGISPCRISKFYSFFGGERGI